MPIHDYYMLQFAILLTFKHFVCDFVLQTDRMVDTKYIYGHPLSLQHSIYHALGTLIICILFVSPKMAFILALVDGAIHYHLDWFKSKFGPDAGHKHYWAWHGADQLLHQLTYILLLILVMSSKEIVDFKL